MAMIATLVMVVVVVVVVVVLVVAAAADGGKSRGASKGGQGTVEHELWKGGEASPEMLPNCGQNAHMLLR